MIRTLHGELVVGVVAKLINSKTQNFNYIAMEQTKTVNLHFFDFVVLSFIFFGYATYSALASYFSEPVSSFDMRTITDYQNWYSIVTELIMLSIAGLYLYLRRFDFKSLNFSLNKHTPFWFLLLVLAGGVAADIGVFSSYMLFPPAVDYTTVAVQEQTVDVSPYQYISISLILFALLNGCYEELFFIGLVYAVDKRYLPYALVGSLFVRFIFHVYQGIPVAIGIMCIGVAFILLRKRVHSLIPFMLAHAVFDIFGASLYAWIYPYII